MKNIFYSPHKIEELFVLLLFTIINPTKVNTKWISKLCIFFTVTLTLSACLSREQKRRIVPQTKTCFEQHRLTAAQYSAIRIEIHADAKAARLDSLFQKKYTRQGLNGTVLIAQKGVTIYENAFGYRDYLSKTKLTLNSAFQLASISKTFTGVAILMMIQEGKLRLNDSIQQYLPRFPYHGITIADLLSHRSGLPNYLYTFENKRMRNEAPPTNDSILKWFCEANPTPAPYGKPGKLFSYNNSNFVMLSCILAKVSGMSYADFIRKRIFEPLEMHHSYIDTPVSDSLKELRTSGHNGNRVNQRDFYDGVYGDKGVYSTVEDMAKWYYALKNNCLLNKYWLKQAFTPRNLEKKSRHNYGLGFRLMTKNTNMRKVEYVYHTGWWQGYSTMFWYSPSNDYIIIILSNKHSMCTYDIKTAITILEGGHKEEEILANEDIDTL
ncbi:MAG: serine hydrolase domain-containing protein [Bacteroidota bacterium]|nr:serine hydrolase domain-containing protein [Bacteroidota bacterium]